MMRMYIHLLSIDQTFGFTQCRKLNSFSDTLFSGLRISALTYFVLTRPKSCHQNKLLIFCILSNANNYDM